VQDIYYSSFIAGQVGQDREFAAEESANVCGVEERTF